MNSNLPELAEGETYVGCIGDALGNLYHIILLPGDNNDATHEAQLEWAKSIGGDLPSRIEQAMLWANHRDQFKKDWYWSNETHHSESGWVWSQCFYRGRQSSCYRFDEIRARAVRRVPINLESESGEEKQPQPDRTAELEAALSKFKDALFDVLIQDMSRDKALAKINEVLKWANIPTSHGSGTSLNYFASELPRRMKLLQRQAKCLPCEIGKSVHSRRRTLV